MLSFYIESCLRVEEDSVWTAFSNLERGHLKDYLKNWKFQPIIPVFYNTPTPFPLWTTHGILSMQLWLIGSIIQHQYHYTKSEEFGQRQKHPGSSLPGECLYHLSIDTHPLILPSLPIKETKKASVSCKVRPPIFSPLIYLSCGLPTSSLMQNYTISPAWPLFSSEASPVDTDIVARGPCIR